VAHGDQGDFSDFLIGRDLVFTGTLLRSESVVHAPAGGCGASKLGSIPGRLSTVRPDSVIAGSLDSAIVQVFAYGGAADDEGAPRPGDRVLAFGASSCDDPGTLWGDAVRVGPDGALRAPANYHIRLDSRPPSEAPRLSEVLAALERKRDRRADVAFEGAAGAALVRVTAVAPAAPRGYFAKFTLVRWVAGTPSPLPDQIRFLPIPQCTGLAAGDTLLLPVGGVRGAAPIEARWCPGRLWVRDGRVPALSASLEHLDVVLVPGLRVVHDRRGH